MKIYVRYCRKCESYLSTCPCCCRADSYLAKNRSEAWKELEAQAEHHDAYIHPDDGCMLIDMLEVRPTRKPGETTP